MFSVDNQKHILESTRAITIYLDEHKSELKPQDQSLANILKFKLFSFYVQFQDHGDKQFGGGVTHTESQSIFLSAFRKELENLDPKLLKEFESN